MASVVELGSIKITITSRFRHGLTIAISTSCIGKTFHFVEIFLRNRQRSVAIIGAYGILEFIFTLQIFNIVFSRLSIRIGNITIKIFIILWHDLQIRGPRTAAIRFHTPQITVGVLTNLQEPFSNIGAPLIFYSFSRLITAISTIVIMEGHSESGAVIVNIDNRGAICCNSNGIRFYKCPQVTVQTSNGTSTVGIMCMDFLTASVAGRCMGVDFTGVAIIAVGVSTFQANLLSACVHST